MKKGKNNWKKVVGILILSAICLFGIVCNVIVYGFINTMISLGIIIVLFLFVMLALKLLTD